MSEFLGEDVEGTGDGGDGTAGQQQQQGMNPAALKQITDRVRSQVVREMMGDPEFAELLRARADKRKVKIVDLDASNGNKPGFIDPDAGTDDSSEQEPNWDEMNNRQLMGHMLKTVKPVLQGAINSVVQPLVQKIQSLEGYAKGHEEQQIAQQVSAFKAKTQDFDSYAEQMAQLAGSNPSLNVEQLYVLAKHSAGQLVPKARLAASEQPTYPVGNSPNRKPKSHTMDAIRASIRKNVSSMVDENPESFME